MSLAAVGILLLVLAFIALGMVGPLYAQRRLRRVRQPTAADRDRFADRSATLGDTVERFLVIETVGQKSIEVAVRGPPGYRVLFVTDYVLETLPVEYATALFAAEGGRLRLYYHEYRVITAGLVLGVGIGAFTGVVPFDVGFAALLVLAIVALALGRHLQYRADAVGAREVGAEALADAFGAVAELRDEPLRSGGWRTYFEVQPPLGARIDRLRRQA